MGLGHSFIAQQFSASVAPLVSRAKYTKAPALSGVFLFLVQQFSASVAPLVSRAKHLNPFHHQGFHTRSPCPSFLRCEKKGSLTIG